MKNIKKLFTLTLALALMLALCVPALATQEDTLTGGSITIENAVPGQTYNAYQILYLESYDTTKGAYSYKANSAWKSFVENEAIKDVYLATDAQGYVTWVKDADAAAFAAAAKAYADANSIEADAHATAATTGESGTTTVTFNNLKLGYYLVDSSLGSLCALDTTNPDVTVTDKNDIPTIEKKVQEDSTNTWGATNDADIGQTVNFKATINIQTVKSGLTMHDKMSTGLTFVEVTAVKVGTDAIEDSNYTVTSDGLTDNCTFEVKFDDTWLKDLDDKTEIVVEYTATLNENAVIGLDGNPNDVRLQFGEAYTQWSQTITYTWDMDVLKYGNGDESKVLQGAEFALLNSDKNKVATVVNGKLTGWVDVPAADTDGNITWPENTVLTTNTSGKIEIDGLDADTYYLREVKAPDGFNKLTEDVEVKVTGAVKEAETTTLTYSTVVAKVNNQSGTELPSTGGIGTTIFYIVGGLLVAGAVVLLVTRKRMNSNG